MTTTDEVARARIRADLDACFVVEAAAGTGKTWCFVERTVEMLARSRASIDGIVAVTFTRKAAGELRLRIRQALYERRRQLGDRHPGAEGERLDDALLRLEEAQIGTIHGFCADLLRRHPVAAGVDPGFEELDHDEAATFRERAFSRWFERALDAGDPVLQRALARTDDGFDAPRARLLQAFGTVADLRDLGSAWATDAAEPDAATAWSLVEALAPLLADVPTKHRSAADYMRVRNVVEVYERWRDRMRDGDVDPIALDADLCQLSKSLRKPKRKLNGDWSGDVKAPEVERRFRELIDALGRYRGDADAWLAPRLKAGLEDALRDYEALKQAAGRLDPVDLLLEARRLLRGHAEVRREESERIDFIGVDELQDTDPVQTEVLMLLSQRDFDGDDWRDVRPDPGRIFLVGDPKQAIYGFRRASMGFHLEMRRRLVEAGLERLELTRSYRALRPIQNLVNRTFAPVFGPVDEPNPHHPGYVPLTGGREARTDQPSIMVISHQVAQLPDDWRRVKDEHVTASSRSVAIFVDWLIRTSGFRVRDGDGWRPIRPRDVAVLFRKMSFAWFERDRIPELCSQLERRDIPFSMTGRSRLGERDEVEAIRTALRAIEWPSDELAVYATLAGPIFAVPDEQLWAYRRRYDRLHPLEALSEGEPADDADLDMVREALAVLGERIRGKAERTVADTLSGLFERTRALAAFAHEPAGSEALAHIDVVLELARAYEQRAPASIRGFIEELDRVRESDAHERPIEKHVEGVRITNVHKAKGLEFPVVILADPLTEPWASDRRHIDPVTGQAAFELLGCRPRELEERAELAREESSAEEDRLAYVAATRARDLLVVTGYGLGTDAMKLRAQSWFGPFHAHLYPHGVAPERVDVLGGDPDDPVSVYEPVTDRVQPRPIAAGEFRLDPGTPYVWVARSILRPEPIARPGLSKEHALIDRGPAAEASAQAFDAWRARREAARAAGEAPSEELIRASEVFEPPPGDPIRVDAPSVPVQRSAGGPRFGQLVHDVLEVVPWGASDATLEALIASAAGPLGAPEDEQRDAKSTVQAALAHPLLVEAAGAETSHREWPVVLRTEPSRVLDGVIDLAFFGDGRWTVVDYKTGRLDEPSLEAARNQVAWYVHALRTVFRQPVRGFVLRL